jgi:RNA polymerase sigma factor (sigma-70 family)
MAPIERKWLEAYAATRDAEAFRCMVEQHQGMVFGTCLRVLGNAADAEDAAQNCFLILAQQAARVKGSLAAWLHHVAVGVSIDIVRQSASRRAREQRVAALRGDAVEAVWDGLKSDVDAAIAALPERLREPVILHYLEGRTQEEVAASLGLTQSAVSKRLQHGVEKLRAELVAGGVSMPGVALASLLSAHAFTSAPASLVASLGKMALAGIAPTAKTTLIGGLTVAKLSAISAVAASVMIVGGVVTYKALSQGPAPTPAAVPPPALAAPDAKEAPPAVEAPFYDYSPMMPFVKAEPQDRLRHPTKEEVKTLGDAWPNVPWWQNGCYYYTRAASLVSNDAPPGAGSSAMPYSGDKEAFIRWAVANRKALDAMQDGLPLRENKLPLFLTTVTQGLPPGAKPFETMSVPHAALARIRNLGRTILDAGFNEELSGRHDAAADWYLREVRMGSQVAADGMLIQSLVGIGCTLIGADDLSRLVQNQELSDVTLRRIIAECRGAESLPNSLVTVWDCEVGCQRYALKAQGLAGRLSGPSPKDQQTIRAVLSRPLSELAAAKGGVKDILDGEVQRGNTSATQTRVLLPGLAAWPGNVALVDLTLRVVEIRAAIQLYHKRDGRLPTNLADMVPDILPIAPEDPFLKAPLHYAVEGNVWRVWSVGGDQKDDGGQFNPGPPWNEPDNVFTSVLATNEAWRRRPRAVTGEAVLMPRTEQDYKNYLAALTGIVWQKGDPVQAHLTWYALKDGLVLADQQTKEVKRINELLGETGIVPSAIAFGADRVWLGTNKGLFAYDRKGGFWTRFAVGGKLVDAAVKELTLSPEGVLSVTAQEAGQATKKYEYDAKKTKWQEK